MSRRIALVAAMLFACSHAPPAVISPSVADPTPTVAATGPTGPRAVRIAAVGDIGEPTDVQRQVARAITAIDNLDAIVLIGDLIYPDGAAKRFREKVQDGFGPALRDPTKVVGVLGNHDVRTHNGADTQRLFGMPSSYFTRTFGPVLLIVLDSNRLDATQLRWLRDQLRGSQQWKVVALHHPMYSSGLHGMRGELEAIRRTLEPILTRGGVDLVLAGHDHDYERTVPIRGIVHIVNGTGCCLRRVGTTPKRTVRALSEPIVVVVDADETTMTIRALRADGSEADRAGLRAAAAAA